MTAVSSTSNPFASLMPPAASNSSTGSQTIDQSGFLTLLTTQMTQQDPTAPMDTSTMVQQLAQMSTVSGITEMNQSLKDLTTQLTGNRIGDAASWIGKKVLLSTTNATQLSDGSYGGEIALPSDASNMSISLVDGNGNTVYSKSLANQKAGLVDFSWDGKLPDGTAATGPLKVVVSASGTAGAIKPEVATWATVTGVQSPAGGSDAALSTALGTIAPTDVLSLS